jgi:hypothetical protein
MILGRRPAHGNRHGEEREPVRRVAVACVAAACLAVLCLSLALALSTALAPALAAAAAEGEPVFGITAWFVKPPRLLQESPLLVRVWGENAYGTRIESTAQIFVPEGIRVLSGQTFSVESPSTAKRAKPERKWQVLLRPEESGVYRIRGTLRIDAGPDRGVDEAEFAIALEVRGDTVLAGSPRPTRFEHVREGQRYRYADRYLVPIDSSEALLQEEIDRKPEVVRQAAAACSACAGTLPAVVPLVVMVGSDGLPREARYLDIVEIGEEIDPTIVEAAKRALAGWEFAPASSRGRPVADYLVVRVPVKAP